MLYKPRYVDQLYLHALIQEILSECVASEADLLSFLLQERQRKYTQLSGPDKATLVLVSGQNVLCSWRAF